MAIPPYRVRIYRRPLAVHFSEMAMHNYDPHVQGFGPVIFSSCFA